MFTLRTEIIACLLAVAVLGLLSGWMMQRARAARRIDGLNRAWEQRHAQAEEAARQDEANLEERLQSLADDIRTLNTENRSLRESLQSREEANENARAEALEHNRRQAETQERLQRIIREREREIASLRTRLGNDPSPPEAGNRGRESIRKEGVPGNDVLDETVRIDPMQLPNARVPEAANERLSPGIAPVPHSADSAVIGALDESLDSTIEVTMLEVEEETVALDEEALALVRGLGGNAKS